MFSPEERIKKGRSRGPCYCNLPSLFVVRTCLRLCNDAPVGQGSCARDSDSAHCLTIRDFILLLPICSYPHLFVSLLFFEMPPVGMSDDKPYPRRIVICCDGTWQSSVSGDDNMPSNVTRLCRVIARMGEDKKTGQRFHQLVYYDSGVGTGNLSTTEKKRQGGVGAGLAENVIEAYNFIVMNYQEGDEIFCFGFSRGAYTARAVAGLVTVSPCLFTSPIQG
jgi:hypothetical protein